MQAIGFKQRKLQCTSQCMRKAYDWSCTPPSVWFGKGHDYTFLIFVIKTDIAVLIGQTVHFYAVI